MDVRACTERTSPDGRYQAAVGANASRGQVPAPSTLSAAFSVACREKSISTTVSAALYYLLPRKLGKAFPKRGRLRGGGG